jgi:hypothetical protein
MSIKHTVSLTALTALVLTSTSLYAEEDHDPSDIARATTSFTVGATNNGDVKGMLTYGFGVTDTQQGMVAVEGNMNQERRIALALYPLGTGNVRPGGRDARNGQMGL